ncbi:MAG: hypothetical protein ACPH4M_06385 [Flavobacteriaceae bacterium]
MDLNNNIYIGNNPARFSNQEVSGDEIIIGDEVFYKISNYNKMRPFFMSIVSNSDHWMFISSTGGLSAGRKNSNYALFPYYTDDKITESSEYTGSKSIFLVNKGDKTFLWEPFSNRQAGVYEITRNLYKNAFGNKVIFEEINHDLEVVYSYEWNSSDTYGFVRKSTLKNVAKTAVDIRLLDGIQNILPYGVEDALQNSTSNLVDAYKKCELETDSGVGIYSLSAIIVDKAEPSEALKANIVWSVGLKNSKKLLSSAQIDSFRRGNTITEEIDVKAERGAYLLISDVTLGENAHEEWTLVANVNQSINDISRIKKSIKNQASLLEELTASVEQGTQQLIALVGASDGLQLTSDRARNTRHFANTMFNIMRGGIFDDNYTIEKEDFSKYLENANHKVYFKKSNVIAALPETFDLNHLKSIAQSDDDKNFKRLCYEYLPLKFSRRHGDPSRPWNKFSINTRNEDGSKILDYQGNWRDIFQNWEALVHSYPEFIEGMIHKFLNATTFDGYNPYRVTKDGFDWETIEPDNPWSYIGYWGDHQIIYLLKFLEFIETYYPNKLESYFSKDLFVYANVPYRIKSYDQILKDPKNTIDFDHEAEARIQLKREEIGVDGALLRDKNIFIYKVNFIEKILATVLAKISNFIPEGGIWMNTQRPEWNDANNALVGNGVSMVTLYYLRRFLKFFETTLKNTSTKEVEISVELIEFFNQVSETLKNNTALLSGSISDQDRKTILDGLGKAASHYRITIYEKSFSGEKNTLNLDEISTFVSVALEHLEHSIEANKRADDLYHAYNLMTIKGNDAVSISYLPEMLEGQVAVLSSGYLSTKEALSVLNALKASKLFRPDQYSYILYPNKTLPRFVDKNTISKEHVQSSSLLQKLVEVGNTQVITKDCNGEFHFNGNFNNVDNLKEALKNLPEEFLDLASKEAEVIYGIFEAIFDHKSFTGRSGTFFGYEGLGSIYWHMVSKLLLAAFETTKQAIDENNEPEIIGKLFDHYFEINAGIGAHKSPELYGAFPTDPYSHTPGGKGAQQPGMTGQVKEDILCRFGELGVRVADGILGFDSGILKASEFLQEAENFNYVDVDQEKQSIALEKDSLAFTICQVPIVYKKASGSSTSVEFFDGPTKMFDANTLDIETTKHVFERTHKIKQITVFVVK